MEKHERQPARRRARIWERGLTRSPAIRRAAEGQDCTLRIVGVCNYDPATTVLCHLGSGTAKRNDDLSAAFGCSSCHDALDRRVMSAELEARRDWYARRAQAETINRLAEMGILTVKGMK